MEFFNFVLLPNLIRIAIHLGSFLGVLILAAPLALLWSKVRKKGFFPRFVLCAWLIVGVLAWLAFHPVIVDTSGTEPSLSPAEREIVLEVSTGLYSGLLPPVAAEVTWRDPDTGDMDWTTYYFPFGHTTMEWRAGEGYNYTRYLFPW